MYFTNNTNKPTATTHHILLRTVSHLPPKILEHINSTILYELPYGLPPSPLLISYCVEYYPRILHITLCACIISPPPTIACMHTCFNGLALV